MLYVNTTYCCPLPFLELGPCRTHLLLSVSFWSPHFLAPSFHSPLFLYLLFSFPSFPPPFPPSTPFNFPSNFSSSAPLDYTPLSPAPSPFHKPLYPSSHTFFYHHLDLLSLLFPFLPLPAKTCRTIRRSTWSTYTAGLTACAPRMKAPTSSSPPLPSI